VLTSVPMADALQLSESSPEELANSIVALLMREASAYRVDCIPKHEQVGTKVVLTVRVNTTSLDRAFRIRLVYVERHNRLIDPSLGRGEINGQWELVLPPYSPYQWEMYRKPQDPSKVADY
jgi:hypothetical protein